jgi:hypothetical protein
MARIEGYGILNEPDVRFAQKRTSERSYNSDATRRNRASSKSFCTGREAGDLILFVIATSRICVNLR